MVINKETINLWGNLISKQNLVESWGGKKIKKKILIPKRWNKNNK